MKKVLSVVLVFVLMLAIVPMGLFDVYASAATSGVTGKCTWSLNGTVLTISGNGYMKDYYDTCGTGAPWAYYKDWEGNTSYYLV